MNDKVAITIKEEALIKLIAKEIEATGGKVDESVVAGVMTAMAEVVTRNIIKGNMVIIPGLAYVKTVFVKQKDHYDIRIRGTATTEAHFRAKFKPLKALKEKVWYGGGIMNVEEDEE